MVAKLTVARRNRKFNLGVRDNLVEMPRSCVCQYGDHDGCLGHDELESSSEAPERHDLLLDGTGSDNVAHHRENP